MANVTLGTLRDYWKKVYDDIVAHDAVDTGDPLKIGGKASTAAPTAVSVGDRVNAWFDLNGRLAVIQDQPFPAGTNLMGKVGIDQTTPGTTNGVQINAAIPAGAALIGKVGIDQTTPGTTNGVQVNAALPAGANNIGDVDVLTLPATNAEGTALISAARTATVSSADIVNSFSRGIHVVLDVTVDPAAASVVLTVEGKDPASGKYYAILTSAAVNSVSTNIYRVHPDLTPAANLIVNDLIPKTFRITVTHADADSFTYSVGYSLV